MPTFGCIDVTLADRVARASVRWPEPCGSVESGVFEAFERLVDWIEDDNPCDALVVALSPMSASGVRSPAPGIEQCRKWENVSVRFDRLACVTIALIDGPCVRFWMQLALACDHRLVTTRAVFRVDEAKEGYLPGMNIFRLAKYVGIGVARRFVFTGDAMDSRSAASFGLVDEVCAPDELELTTQSFLARLAPIHPVPLQLARRLLNESFSTAFEQFLGQYLASQHRCLSGVTPSDAMHSIPMARAASK